MRVKLGIFPFVISFAYQRLLDTRHGSFHPSLVPGLWGHVSDLSEQRTQLNGFSGNGI
jgi:hypothetical protein